MGLSRLNLPLIEASLRAVQQDFHQINARLTTPRDPIGDDVLANLVAGYVYVDRLLTDDIDIFAMGHLKHLLEMNALVLCGSDGREKYTSHLKATEEKFYEEPGGGVRDLVEWMAGHSLHSSWRRAAGAYARILSEPQLFIEGNHRTGALVMSYILVREGQPPFVLSAENAVSYFDSSTVFRSLHKGTLDMLVSLPGIHKDFAEFLEGQANASYLFGGSSCVHVDRPREGFNGG